MRKIGFVIISIILVICISCSSKKLQIYSIKNTCDISVYLIKDEQIKDYYSTKDIAAANKILSVNDFASIKEKKDNDRVLFFAVINKEKQNTILKSWNDNVGNWIIIRINNKDTIIAKILDQKETVEEIYIWDNSKSGIITMDSIISSKK